MMKYEIYEAPVVYDRNGVSGRLVFKGENGSQLLLAFEPGCTTDSHVQHDFMTFFIIKGKAAVIVDGREHFISENQLFSIGAGRTRQWSNIAEEPLEILVSRFPVTEQGGSLQG